ncbi:MAG: sulfurtransferase [Cycloclasticus sp. symbiont of Bathymodiolus heckerae]|nr:MAG: sulfurtransferase [Cycloclasticus sp. symbiont of Bathymodiolus heckerae]
MIKAASEFIAEAQQHINCLDPVQAKKLLDETKDALVLDVREPGEAAEAKLSCSVNIPRGLLEMKIQKHCTSETTTIVTHCAGGGRASLAAARLKEMGYTNVYAITAKFADVKALIG